MASFSIWHRYVSLLLFITPLLFLFKTTEARCECGFQVFDQVFTHTIFTRFTRIINNNDITEGSGNQLADWEVSEWKGKKNGEKGDDLYLLPKQMVGENISIWNGTLNLKMNGYSKAEAERESHVKGSEITTRRDDILYGSFRSRFRVIQDVNDDGGAVAGFFFYHDDEEETDIEILTKEDDQRTLHYSNQPTYNEDTGDGYYGTSTPKPLPLPWNVYQEHRWDWLPNGTTFYHNNRVAYESSINTPTRKGQIMLNLWADGGSWSGMPSTTDVIMQVEYIELYFNTSLSHSGADRIHNERCDEAGGVTANDTICQVEYGKRFEEDNVKDSAGTRTGILQRHWVLMIVAVSCPIAFAMLW